MSDQATSAASGGPPRSIQELRAELARAGTRGSRIRLGKRAFQVLAGMVDSPHQAAVFSISELAAALGANPSTLTRLAQRLGYPGFAGLQDVFRRHVARDGAFYSDRAGRLLQACPVADGDTSLVLTVVQDELTNIATMVHGVDGRAVEGAAGLLDGARRVRVHGLRQFFAVASFFTYGLGMLRRDVDILGGPQHGIGHGLAQLGPEDALVVVGCAPYTRATVDACRVAGAHGIPIVAITDSYGSPLAGAAAYCFIAPTEGSFFSNSMASYMVLAEGVLGTVARRMGREAMTALGQREDLMSQLRAGT